MGHRFTQIFRRKIANSSRAKPAKPAKTGKTGKTDALVKQINKKM